MHTHTCTCTYAHAHLPCTHAIHTCRAQAPCTRQVFRALEADLQLGPSALSTLALLQSLSMAVAAPVWGVLADTWSRRSLLSTAVFGWAVSSVLNGCATSLGAFAVLRALNGAALAVTTPPS